MISETRKRKYAWYVHLLGIPAVLLILWLAKYMQFPNKPFIEILSNLDLLLIYFLRVTYFFAITGVALGLFLGSLYLYALIIGLRRKRTGKTEKPE